MLAFACFADAPVDVVVLEVGMGGEWDSTNVADGQVAVFTPIDLDHQSRLGSTITEIARTKSGIIKPAASVVSAKQPDAALEVLEDAAELTESTLAVEGDAFDVLESRVAVGGQLISIRGLAGEYRDIALPLFGGTRPRTRRSRSRRSRRSSAAGPCGSPPRSCTRDSPPRHPPGACSRSPPTRRCIVDAAHNPHGAEALVAALDEYFDFDEVVFVFGVLADKDAEGIAAALARTGGSFLVTRPDSDRARDASDLAAAIAARVGADRVQPVERLDDALDEARAWAAEAPKRAVVVTGSIGLVGEAMAIAADRGWGRA